MEYVKKQRLNNRVDLRTKVQDHGPMIPDF